MLPIVVAAVRHQLAAGMRCMYLNSPAMIAGFRSQLYAAGTDVEHEIRRNALVLAGDIEHLDQGRFAIDKMMMLLETAVEQALADGFTGLFATGDMTWEFGPEKDFSKLLEYEWRLEQLFRRQPALAGICQYHRDLMPSDAIREGAISHDGVFLSATLSRLNPLYVPADTLAERQAAAASRLDVTVDDILASKV